MRSLKEILSLYGIAPLKIKPLKGGLINKTWRIKTKKSTLILQWVNPIFSHKIMPDLVVVTNELKNKGFTTFEIIKTKKDEIFIKDKKGFWRLLTYVEGHVHEKIKSKKMAMEAGMLLGKFHKALSRLEYEFHFGRALHRQSENIYKKYSNILNKRNDIFNSKFKKKLQPINDLPTLLLPKNLPRSITHGDPKITNMVFDKSGNAIALIDLDDCGDKHNVLVDVGDALLSWCMNADATLSIKLFENAVRGYMKGSQNLLSKKEIELIPQALKLITLELTTRFAIDIAEDCYFGWDNKKYSSRREHNIARVLGLIKFYKNICKHEKKLNILCSS